MANQEVRELMKEKKVFQWQIADRLGISEGGFCRKLRHELSKEEANGILAIIHDISKAV